MRTGNAAAAVALACVVLAACTARTQTPIAPTASVTVNEHNVKFSIVNCTQIEWYRTIHIGGDYSGATVAVDGRRDPAITQSVHVQNIGGFTGMYSQGDGSDPANTSLSGGKFTITGTAHGYMVDKPGEPVTATFKINAGC